ncbi:MAG: hypothetical protein PHH49_08365 [Candidatus Omnitrophica bacterium]|jgi:hypothetical protein|nr:hypothetical protein [Candidatus Omnitrophota bacterium]
MQPGTFSADTYTLSTPYGIVSVSQAGRRISFELFTDVRESMHHKALFHYCQSLKKRGITRYNVAHLHLPDTDRSINLKRGSAYLDLAYYHRGILFECELKTNREIGLDRTASQLKELSKHCENLRVLVPTGSMADMATILHMIHLDQKISVDTYEYTDEEPDTTPEDFHFDHFQT